jgi:arylsulfatase A-like enzyme
MRAVLFGETGAADPQRAFFYYRRDDLEAVRSGTWKLHLRRGELYDLAGDVGEQNNLAARHPEIVRGLERLADGCRADLGDAASGAAGQNCRRRGVVETPQPLTVFDPTHPYIMAMYDIEGSAQAPVRE